MSRKVQNGSHLFACQSIKHLHDFVDRKAVLEILEDRSGWDACSPENPCATDLARHAFYSRTS
jgi:hypothetical protein